MTAKYGTPYFSNYINSDMEPSDVRSMCCRLRLDLRELRKKSGGFFGSGESTGSIGVVTINMPRIAYLSADEADFYKRLDQLMDISARSLQHEARRSSRSLLDEGLYPYTKRYLGTFENHFSTIGLVGMNEACLNAQVAARGHDARRRRRRSPKDVLNHMREPLGRLPGSSTATCTTLRPRRPRSTTYRFAKHDKEQFPDIVTANDQGKPYYTNSLAPAGGLHRRHLRARWTCRTSCRRSTRPAPCSMPSSARSCPTGRAAATLVRKIAENYKLPYYTMSPTYSVCKNHGYIAGEVYECPCCHEETEVYSRITGYYRPVKNWNDGKSQEFADRVVYDLGHSHLVKGDAQVAAAAAAVAGAAGSAGAAAKAGEGEAMTVSDAVAAAMGEAAPQAAGPAAAEAPESSMLPAGRYLVATRTCPNCKHAAAQMDQAGIAYEELLAEENVELAQRFRIMQAPTLLEVSADGTVDITAGAAAVFQKINALRAQVVA